MRHGGWSLVTPRLLLVHVFLVLASLVAAPAWAQDEWASPDEQARALFAQGEAAYGEGHFEEALGLFQRAYDLSGRPQLLYNIGISATNLGHDTEALDALERYLAALPEAPNRALVEGRLESLRRRIAEHDTAVQAAEQERARVEAERAQEARRRAEGAESTRTLGWGLAIAGAALAVGGAVLLGVGYADLATVDGAADGTRWVDVRDAAAQAPILTGVGWGSLGVGLALAGAGLGVALGTGSPAEEGVTVSLGPGTVVVGGRF